MRTGLRVTLIVVAVVAVLVLLLVATPVGWRLASGLIEGAASDATGLEVAIGSLRGNLLRNATLEDVRLVAPEGPAVFSAGEIQTRYNLVSLVKGDIVVPELRVEDAELLFVTGADGEVVGWSKLFAPSEEPEAPPDTLAEPPLIDVEVELVNWRVVVADSVAGYALDVTALDLEARGGLEEFEASLQGSLRFTSRELERSVEGEFQAGLTGNDEELTLEALELGTNVGRLAARAT